MHFLLPPVSAQVRFVESFHGEDGSFWLVFRHEGTALHALMYAPLPANDADGNPRAHPAGSVQQVATDDHGKSMPDGSHESDSTHESDDVPLQILQPSPWWWSMRRGSRRAFVDLLQSMLRALAAVHAANITHRYAAPPNARCWCSTRIEAVAPSTRAAEHEC